MKLKKKVKKRITILFLIILIGICAFLSYKIFFNKKEDIKENKVLKTIEKYNYTLKDNKTAKYKKMFEKLNEILSAKKVDEEKYVKQISKMFIYDFYSLQDKTSKTDVGGVDFVYANIIDNFLLNAQDTYYKYIESNVYGNRKQKLPEVDEITIDSIKNESFTIAGGDTDEKAYYVNINWEYTSEDFNTYQKSAELVFIHNGIRLDLVELQK